MITILGWQGESLAQNKQLIGSCCDFVKGNQITKIQIAYNDSLLREGTYFKWMEFCNKVLNIPLTIEKNIINGILIGSHTIITLNKNNFGKNLLDTTKDIKLFIGFTIIRLTFTDPSMVETVMNLYYDLKVDPIYALYIGYFSAVPRQYGSGGIKLFSYNSTYMPNRIINFTRFQELMKGKISHTGSAVNAIFTSGKDNGTVTHLIPSGGNFYQDVEKAASMKDLKERYETMMNVFKEYKVIENGDISI